MSIVIVKLKNGFKNNNKEKINMRRGGELADFMLSLMFFAKKSSSSAEKESDRQENLRIYKCLYEAC